LTWCTKCCAKLTHSGFQPSTKYLKTNVRQRLHKHWRAFELKLLK
jgi:hypothetical protein